MDFFFELENSAPDFGVLAWAVGIVVLAEAALRLAARALSLSAPDPHAPAGDHSPARPRWRSGLLAVDLVAQALSARASLQAIVVDPHTRQSRG